MEDIVKCLTCEKDECDNCYYYENKEKRKEYYEKNKEYMKDYREKNKKGVPKEVSREKKKIRKEYLMKGFDCNQILSSSDCEIMKEMGYDFVIRYVGRNVNGEGDLWRSEREKILKSGLSLGIVQHCPCPDWKPVWDLGNLWGIRAGVYSENAGYKKGCIIFLDWEGISKNSSYEDCINFIQAWVAQVEGKGYKAGLYYGYNPRIPIKDLNGWFDVYWCAYNMEDVFDWDIKQGLEKKQNGICFDSDILVSEKIINFERSDIMTEQEIRELLKISDAAYAQQLCDKYTENGVFAEKHNANEIMTVGMFLEMFRKMKGTVIE